MRNPFSNRLLYEATCGPSEIRAFAIAAMQTWALLPMALSAADAIRDSELAHELIVLDAVLSEPDPPAEEDPVAPDAAP